MKKNKVENEDENFRLFIYFFIFIYINFISEKSPIFADFEG